MKEKSSKFKEFFKRYLIGFFTGIIVFSGFSVIAMTYFPSKDVTYENGSSGLEANNVQGAIDELYNICVPSKTGGDAVLDKVAVATSGDGLYKDEYEDGKYTYKGADPNNYIIFNDEIWRIISINSDNTIKIIRNTSIGDNVWDQSSSCYVTYNEVQKVKDKIIVENIIYTAPDPGGSDKGCNNWTRPSDLNTYLNDTYFASIKTNKDKVVPHTWSVGTVEYENNNLDKQITDENKTQSQNAKVGMITVSEYLRANSNVEQCGNFKLNNTNNLTCEKTNWLWNNWYWTITPDVSDEHKVFAIASASSISSLNVSGRTAFRPVLYLSSDIKITGGDGSKSNPYILG